MQYAETRDRTGDLQIFSLTLSQLSYRGAVQVPQQLQHCTFPAKLFRVEPNSILDFDVEVVCKTKFGSG